MATHTAAHILQDHHPLHIHRAQLQATTLDPTGAGLPTKCVRLDLCMTSRQGRACTPICDRFSLCLFGCSLVVPKTAPNHPERMYALSYHSPQGSRSTDSHPGMACLLSRQPIFVPTSICSMDGQPADQPEQASSMYWLSNWESAPSLRGPACADHTVHGRSIIRSESLSCSGCHPAQFV